MIGSRWDGPSQDFYALVIDRQSMAKNIDSFGITDADVRAKLLSGAYEFVHANGRAVATTDGILRPKIGPGWSLPLPSSAGPQSVEPALGPQTAKAMELVKELEAKRAEQTKQSTPAVEPEPESLTSQAERAVAGWEAAIAAARPKKDLGDKVADIVEARLGIKRQP